MTFFETDENLFNSLYAKKMILPNRRFGIQKNFHAENPEKLILEAGKMAEQLERKSYTKTSSYNSFEFRKGQS